MKLLWIGWNGNQKKKSWSKKERLLLVNEYIRENMISAGKENLQFIGSFDTVYLGAVAHFVCLLI